MSAASRLFSPYAASAQDGFTNYRFVSIKLENGYRTDTTKCVRTPIIPYCELATRTVPEKQKGTLWKNSRFLWHTQWRREPCSSVFCPRSIKVNDAPGFFGRSREKNLALVQMNTRLMLRSGGKVHFVEAPTVLWVEANDNYVLFYTQDKSYKVRMTIEMAAHLLEQFNFVRIHRSRLVNGLRVRELEHKGNECDVILHNGQRFAVSRRYRKPLLERMGV